MKPLTFPDCDLRNFPHMPLDVVRLRDSDLAALEGAEEFRAAVLLWCASWHQVPAASLPNDDKILANLAGFGRVVKEWNKVKQGAMRGWVLCDDGRFYHPVIAEKANTAIESKYKQEWKTELSRIKKHNQRHPQNQLPYPEYDEYMSQRTDKDCPQGQNDNVPETSPWKQPPTEQNRTEQNTVVSNIHTDKTVPSVSPIATACIAIREVYDLHRKPPTDISQSNPTLQALIAAGATVDEFRDAAIAAMQAEPPKGFAWIIGRVKGMRADAANLPDVSRPPMRNGSSAKEAGRNIAASSIFTPETTKHLRGNPQPTRTEIEVTDEKLQ